MLSTDMTVVTEAAIHDLQMLTMPTPLTCRKSSDLKSSKSNAHWVRCSYPQAVPIGNLTKSADFSGCGSTKACFLYPLQCKGSDCVAAVSFQYRNVTDDYQVEMYADPGPSPDYVGVAFSADDEMVIVISSHIIHWFVLNNSLL